MGVDAHNCDADFRCTSHSPFRSKARSPLRKEPSVIGQEYKEKGARRTTLSLAAFVVICFFLPWVQLSCVGMKDSVSGFDLAREGDELLWLVPLFMVAVVVLGLVRVIWEKMPAVFALAGTVGGGACAYLMYHERAITNNPSRLVATQWTLFFWLGFLASLGVVTSAFILYLKRSRDP